MLRLLMYTVRVGRDGASDLLHVLAEDGTLRYYMSRGFLVLLLAFVIGAGAGCAESSPEPQRLDALPDSAADGADQAVDAVSVDTTA
jgi:hypothetical protein